jgi:hypothetical protein
MAIELRSPYYKIELQGDWRVEASADPIQRILVSDSRRAQLTLSHVAMDARGRDLGEIARKLIEFRLKAERDATPGREVIIQEPWSSVPAPGSIQVNYMGKDSLDRYFFYVGFVTEAHVVNITGEVEKGSDEALRALYIEALANFGF